MKGVHEVIAIILILMIVIALAMLAYTWFSGIYNKFISVDNSADISVNSGGIRASDILSFMNLKGCSSLSLWWDGTLKCSRQDCKSDGYCKYVYDDVV